MTILTTATSFGREFFSRRRASMSTDKTKTPAVMTPAGARPAAFGVGGAAPMTLHDDPSLDITTHSSGFAPDLDRPRVQSQPIPQERAQPQPLTANQKQPTRESALKARDKLQAKQRAQTEARAHHT